MKSKLMILAGIFLVAAVAILSFGHPQSSPRPEMGFLGFTNSGASPWPLAMFAISNRPNLAVTLHSLQHVNPNPLLAEQSARWEWSRATEWGMIEAVAVTTTNDPLAIVFQFQERAGGFPRVAEQIRELWGRVTGHEQEFFTGRKFLVTNTTSVPVAPR